MFLTEKLTIKFWFVQLCTLLVLMVFTSLGYWQLERGRIKSAMQAKQNQQGSVFEAVSLPLRGLETWRYKKVSLFGEYLTGKQFLLDNQVRDGVAGYNIFTPFQDKKSQLWFLVDRGWLPQAQYREVLPDIDFVSRPGQVAGTVYIPYSEAYRLGGIDDGEKQAWPRRVQYIDYEQLSLKLGKALQKFTLRLDTSQANGYRRDWSAAALPARKHYGYAVQWFAMALAVIILWWLYSVKPLLNKNAG